jgi:hypothetical protein
VLLGEGGAKSMTETYRCKWHRRYYPEQDADRPLSEFDGDPAAAGPIGARCRGCVFRQQRTDIQEAVRHQEVLDQLIDFGKGDTKRADQERYAIDWYLRKAGVAS